MVGFRLELIFLLFSSGSFPIVLIPPREQHLANFFFFFSKEECITTVNPNVTFKANHIRICKGTVLTVTSFWKIPAITS